MGKIKVRPTIIPDKLEATSTGKMKIIFSLFFSFELEPNIDSGLREKLSYFPELLIRSNIEISSSNTFLGTYSSLGKLQLEIDQAKCKTYWEYFFNDNRISLEQKKSNKFSTKKNLVFFENSTDEIRSFNNLFAYEAIFKNVIKKDLKSAAPLILSSISEAAMPTTARYKNIEKISSLSKVSVPITTTSNGSVYFTDLISHFSDYQPIQEKLCILIKENAIEVDQSQLSQSGCIKVQVLSSAANEVFDFVDTSQIIGTNYALDVINQKFTLQTLSKLYDTGYVKLNDATRYSIEQSTVAEISLKSTLISAKENTSSNLPTRNSKGFYLIEKKTNDDKKYLNRDIEDILKTGLFLEDLILGYRFDLDKDDKGFNSLHLKITDYKFLKNEGLNITQINEEGYGQIDQAVKTDQGDFLFADYICHFSGWSLSVETPLQKQTSDFEKDDFDKKIAERRSKNEVSEADELNEYLKEKILISSTVKKGSIPKLRFNSKYRFRARIVTIDGISETYLDNNSSFATNYEVYRRLESTIAPSFVPREKLKEVTVVVDGSSKEGNLKGKEGESEFIIVIRSYDNNAHTREISRRGIAPPETTWQVAEWHAYFDQPDGSINVNKLESVTNFLPDGKWSNDLGKFHDYFDNRIEVPYLADVMCQGFEIICDENPLYSLIFDNGNDNLLFFTSESEWPIHVKLWDIKIKELKKTKTPKSKRLHNCIFNVNNHNRTIEILLAKGEDLNFKIRSFPIVSDCVNSPFAIASSIGDELKRMPEIDSDKSRAVDIIRNCRLIRSNHLYGEKEFRVVHAVKKPIEKPDFKNDVLVQRTWNPDELTSGLVICKIFFPGKTAKVLQLYANLIDVTDDPNDISRYGTNNIVREKEKVFDYFIESKIQKKTNSFWELGQVVPFESNVNRKDVKENVEKTFYAIHRLPSSKAYRVEYFLNASSRFTEFYDNKTNGEEFIEISKKQTCIIPASKAPSAPNFEYAIPLLETKSDGNNLTQTGDGIRLFFKGPWFSSGFEEKIAILVASDPNMQSEKMLHSFVSSWGRDITTSGENLKPISIENFAKTYAVKEGLTVDHPNFKKRNLKTISQECLNVFSAAIYEIQPYNINGKSYKIDGKNKLWYVDIKFKEIDAYFPFIQLAVARYQEHAIPFEELSSPIVCDFIQLAPNRIVSITRNGAQVTVKLNSPIIKKSFNSKGQIEASNVVFIKNPMINDLYDDKETDALIYNSNIDKSAWIRMELSDEIEEGCIWSLISHIPKNTKVVLKEFEFFKGIGNTEEDTTDPENDSRYRLVFGIVIIV